MNRGFSAPSLRDQLVALGIAIACALCFLRSTVSPNNALLPYPPEFLQPARASSLAAGTPTDEIFRGNTSMGDKYGQSLAWDRITQTRLSGGEIPLWTRDIAGGVPFVPQMGQVYHPMNLLLLALPSAGIYGIWYLLHLVLMGFFAYRFLRRIRVGHQAAVFGMAALILGFWAQARVHHNVMLSAALPLFPMLSCAHHLMVHRGGRGHMAMLGLATGLSWISGFAPASLMSTYLTTGFALALATTQPRGQRLRPLIRTGSAIALGIGLAAAQLIPVLMASQIDSRPELTLAHFDSRSMETGHLATLLWPTLFHWPADHLYLPLGVRHEAWANFAFLNKGPEGANFNFPETAFYLGLIPLSVLLTSLGSRRGLFFAAGALFGLGMALAPEPFLSLSQFLPGAEQSDLKRFLLLFGVCAPVMAALGLDRILRGGTPWPARGVLAAIGLLSVALLVFHLRSADELLAVYGPLIEERHGRAPGEMAAYVYEGEAEVNRWQLLLGFGSAGLVCILGLLLFWRRGSGAGYFLTAVTAAELLWLGSGTIVSIPTKRVSEPPEILTPVLEATQPNGVRPRLQRLLVENQLEVMTMPVMPNMAAFWGIEDLSAYNPLPKQRMEDIFRWLEPDRPGKAPVALGGAGVAGLHDPNSLTHPLADLLGIEWVLSEVQIDLPGIAIVESSDGGYHLYRRDTCLPRATFLTAVVVLPEAEDRRVKLSDRSHDPSQTVILEDLEAPMPAAAQATDAQVEILEHADELVRIRVQCASEGYLRLADPFDAGWTATVDGTSATIYQADHYLRAVHLGPGEHTVEFRYDSPLLVRGPQTISLAALLVLILLGLTGLRRSRSLAEADLDSSNQEAAEDD